MEPKEMIANIQKGLNEGFGMAFEYQVLESKKNKHCAYQIQNLIKSVDTIPDSTDS